MKKALATLGAAALIALWLAAPALADPVGGCGTGKPCSVSTLKVTNGSSLNCLQIDGNVLKVDCVNNRVGINVTSPAVALDVVGDIATTQAGSIGVTGTGTGCGLFQGTGKILSLSGSASACSAGVYLSTASGSGPLKVAINSANELQLTSTELAPDATGGSSLGSEALRWLNAFIHANGAIYMAGADPSAFVALPNGSTSYGQILFDNNALKSQLQANVDGQLRLGGYPDPALQRRQAFTAYVNESTSTAVNVGWSAALVPTDAAAATLNTNDATRTFRNFVTTAAAGGTSSVLGPDITLIGHTPAFAVDLRTDQSAVTSTRIWAGLTDRTVAQMNADDPASGNLCAFRYATDSSDTNWMLCTKDGTTLSCVSTGVAVAAATSYVMRLELTTGGCWGYISSGSGVTFAAYRQRRLTNLPGSAANLKAVVMIEARAAAARALGFNNLTFETR